MGQACTLVQVSMFQVTSMFVRTSSHDVAFNLAILRLRRPSEVASFIACEPK